MAHAADSTMQPLQWKGAPLQHSCTSCCCCDDETHATLDPCTADCLYIQHMHRRRRHWLWHCGRTGWCGTTQPAAPFLQYLAQYAPTPSRWATQKATNPTCHLLWHMCCILSCDSHLPPSKPKQPLQVAGQPAHTIQPPGVLNSTIGEPCTPATSAAVAAVKCGVRNDALQLHQRKPTQLVSVCCWALQCQGVPKTPTPGTMFKPLHNPSSAHCKSHCCW